jgi:membrane-bound serine protease (ClpP class)
MNASGARHLPTILLASLAMLLLGAGPATAPSARPAPAALEQGGRAAIIVLDSAIDESARRGLENRFAQARELGVSTVVLRLSTYGGLVTSGLEISQFLKRQDDLRIICYVDGKAISAGAMIAVACDQIVMAPNAQIGDSGVIAMGPGGGLTELGQTERAKFESPVIEDFRDSARENGYPEVLLEAMVNVGRTVYWVQNTQTGERRFVDEKGYGELTGGGVFGNSAAAWKAVEGVRSPIDAADSLLMLSTDLAVQLGLAREQATSIENFTASRGLSVVAVLKADAGERLISLLSGEMVRALLMTVFMLALYAAFHTPGTGAPEVIAVVALGMLLGVPALTGYAQWYEIMAIILGIVLLALELFVIPGFGVSGISGILLVLAGLTMTFVPPIVLPNGPQRLYVDWVAVRNGFLYVTGGLAASLLLWVWLSRSLPHLPYANRLILSTVAGGPVSATGAADTIPAPEIPVIGEIGEALTDLRPGGRARFEGTSRISDVVSDSGFVQAGARVVVREVAGRHVVVRPVQSTQPLA